MMRIFLCIGLAGIFHTTASTDNLQPYMCCGCSMAVGVFVLSGGDRRLTL